ncbi:MAG: CPBP family intramembrane metalloprotease [Acidobacteria bacterium]|nr:CPBP family intramembrane metalloprotease [Acidobacteriota bacterium]
MSLPNPLKAAEYVHESARHFQMRSKSALGLRSVFVGPNGLRAGWRLLVFAALVVILLGSSLIIRNGGIQGFREAHRHEREITVTPLLLGMSTGIAFALLCVATWIMSRIERRKFSEYGLCLRRAMRKEFWTGSVSGFLAIGATLLAMFLLHGFRITGLALHGAAILSSLVEWGSAFLLAGLCEEFLCRGYAQYTLTTVMGFWPAALVTSVLFAFGHVFNANETGVGVAAVVLFGLLHCLFLQRTRNLWCAVGFHAGWDFGQTFYGVPDSGIVPYHNVFSSAFQGPQWLTGGMVGPEASVLTPIALLVVALVFSCYYREDRYPIRSVPLMLGTGS